MGNTLRLKKRLDLKEYSRIATLLLELALRGPRNLSQLSDLLIKEGLRPVSARPATTRIVNYLERIGFVKTIGKGPRGARLVDITPKTLYYIVSMTLEELLCIPIEIISRYGNKYNIDSLKEITSLLQRFVEIFGQKCEYDSKFIRELTFFLAYSIEAQESMQEESGVDQDKYLKKVEDVLKHAIIDILMSLINYFEEDIYEDVYKSVEDKALSEKMNEVMDVVSRIISELKKSNASFAKDVLQELKNMLYAKKKSLELSLNLVSKISNTF